VIPYGKWHSVAVTWCSITAIQLPLPLCVKMFIVLQFYALQSFSVRHFQSTLKPFDKTVWQSTGERLEWTKESLLLLVLWLGGSVLKASKPGFGSIGLCCINFLGVSLLGRKIIASKKRRVFWFSKKLNFRFLRFLFLCNYAYVYS